MKGPLSSCVNGDGRPIQPPSWVLCAECFAELDAKMRALGEALDAPKPPRPEERKP